MPSVLARGLLLLALPAAPRAFVLGRAESGRPASAQAALFIGAGCKGQAQLLSWGKRSLCTPGGGSVRSGDDETWDDIEARVWTQRIGEPGLSVRVFNPADGKEEAPALSLYEGCNGDRYWSTVTAEDGCVNIYSWPQTDALHLMPRGVAPPGAGERGEVARGQQLAQPTFHVVMSTESSRYQGYQSIASYYSFLKTGQAEKGGAYTRLLTAQSVDDLAEKIPTFTAPRHPYSRRYGPLNKPDVLMKWMTMAPPVAEKVVIVDPDSWFVGAGDMSPYLSQVQRGRGVAPRGAAGPNLKLWKRVCAANCSRHPQSLAVPYMVHRDDVLELARLAREYTLRVHEGIFQKEFPEDEVRGLDWMAEMAGFNFAAAHMGLDFKYMETQRRDVDPVGQKDVPFLHMGRAFFPRGEGGEWDQHEQVFTAKGDQVWCKCNDTADFRIPWPVPEGTDWVSRETLELLHEGLAWFGPLAANETLRPREYYQPMM